MAALQSHLDKWTATSKEEAQPFFPHRLLGSKWRDEGPSDPNAEI